ncbi:MAG TPA: hypothetical protein VHZ73_08425 [Vicinamibacterales bacterium]|jgi:hypothetical protein|nr:hypothetical protein [Vicinamibacterales bacterium]
MEKAKMKKAAKRPRVTLGRFRAVSAELAFEKGRTSELSGIVDRNGSALDGLMNRVLDEAKSFPTSDVGTRLIAAVAQANAATRANQATG